MVLAWLLKTVLVTIRLVRAAAVRDLNQDLETKGQNSLEVRDPNQDLEIKGRNSLEVRDHNPDPEVRDQNSLEIRDLNRSVIRS